MHNGVKKILKFVSQKVFKNGHVFLFFFFLKRKKKCKNVAKKGCTNFLPKKKTLRKSFHPTVQPFFATFSKIFFKNLRKFFPLLTNFLPIWNATSEKYAPRCLDSTCPIWKTSENLPIFTNLFQKLHKIGQFAQTFCQNGMLLQKNFFPTALSQLARKASSYHGRKKSLQFSQTCCQN